LHPGEIDNLSIARQDPGDVNSAEPIFILRTQLEENVTHVLLPSAIYSSLRSRYGSKGDLDFTRKVVNDGTPYAPAYRVDLHPFYLRLHVCAEDSKDGTRTEVCPDLLLTHGHETLKELALRSHQHCQGATNMPLWVENQCSLPVRFWLKLSAQVESRNARITSRFGGSSGRDLTEDKVEVNGCWRFLSPAQERYRTLTIDDVSSLVSALEPEAEGPDASRVMDMLVERAVQSHSTGGGFWWPWDSRRMLWTQTLRPGDMLDAMDDYKKWFESRVVAVESQSSSGNLRVRVHFMGWGDNWDIWINAVKDRHRLQPLHSMVADWRSDVLTQSQIEVKALFDANKPEEEWKCGKILMLLFFVLFSLLSIFVTLSHRQPIRNSICCRYHGWLCLRRALASLLSLSALFGTNLDLSNSFVQVLSPLFLPTTQPSPLQAVCSPRKSLHAGLGWPSTA
jgi:hypothetical protein